MRYVNEFGEGRGRRGERRGGAAMFQRNALCVQVLVGDVVLVSGQSNVGISVQYSNQ